MRAIRHTLLLSRLLLGFHLSRPRDLLLVGLAFMVGSTTLAVLLAIPAGLERLAGRTGIPGVVVVLSAAASTEVESELSPIQVGLLGSLPQVARGIDGRPILAPQFVAATRMVDGAGRVSTVQLRGVTPALGALLAPGHGNDPGSLPEPGSQALVAGREAAQRLGIEPGSPIKLRGRDWQVDSILDADGSLWESELWVEQSALQAAFRAPGRISVAWVWLAADAEFDQFAAAVAAEPRLDGLRVIEQTRYYQAQVGFLAGLARAAAWSVSLLLGAGAVIAIGNALGVVMSARRVEMATLRALGFRDAGVVLANLLEVVVMSILVAAGCLLVLKWTVDGLGFATSTGIQAVYAAFAITPSVAGWVMLYTIALALAGGIMPVVRLVSGSPMNALRGD